MKKILCNTLIIIILAGVICNGYTQNFSLSKSDRLFCYAEGTSVSRDEFVESFKDYCASRNLISDSSVLGASAEWLGSTLSNICNALGIDMDYLQAQISKDTSGNLGIRWLITGSGIGLYNRIFAELLQRYNLEVGGSANQKVYQGYNYNGLMYKLYGNSSYLKVADGKSYIKEYGGSYLHDPSYYTNLFKSVNPNIDYSYKTTAQSHTAVNFSISYDNYTYDSTLRLMQQVSSSNPYRGMQPAIKWDGSIASATTPCYVQYCNNVNWSGQSYFALFLFEDSKVGFGSIGFFKDSNGNVINPIWIKYISDNLPDDSEPTDVDIYTPDDKNILPDLPENPTTIYPDGGGGGGDDPEVPDPDDPLDPYDPNKPFPDTPDNPTPDPGVHGSPGSDGTITLPDFNFDIPDINWSLDGLQHKFPFSLPFDLYNACKLLNAEPQTPELDYTVDLVVYQWPIQMDLHWLDPAARVIRIFELLAFVVGLILITRHLIGG